jgi:hypothetical protein
MYDDMITEYGNYVTGYYGYLRGLSGTTGALLGSFLGAALMTWLILRIYKLSYGFSVFVFLFAYLYTMMNRMSMLNSFTDGRRVPFTLQQSQSS